MNKTELIAAVAEKSGLSKKDSEAAVVATIAAITDVQLALALVKAMPKADPQTLEVLTAKAAKAKKRQMEAKAHQRNLRKGKK